MAYAKLETTGLAVRKGKVQIRFSFYLEPNDARYDEHHVQVPDPLSEKWQKGYPGVYGDMGPLDEKDYQKWYDSLPKIWQNNPFHNHFVYVDPDVTDGEISKLMREHLQEFYGLWAEGVDITKAWREMPLKAKQHFDETRKQFISLEGISSKDFERYKSRVKACEAKVLDIKNRASAFEHREIA